MSDEDVIVDLQMRMMEQEQSIEALSQQVLHQTGQIDTLLKNIKVLEMKLTALGEAGTNVTDDDNQTVDNHRPPHY